MADDSSVDESHLSGLPQSEEGSDDESSIMKRDVEDGSSTKTLTEKENINVQQKYNALYHNSRVAAPARLTQSDTRLHGSRRYVNVQATIDECERLKQENFQIKGQIRMLNEDLPFVMYNGTDYLAEFIRNRKELAALRGKITNEEKEKELLIHENDDLRRQLTALKANSASTGMAEPLVSHFDPDSSFASLFSERDREVDRLKMKIFELENLNREMKEKMAQLESDLPERQLPDRAAEGPSAPVLTKRQGMKRPVDVSGKTTTQIVYEVFAGIAERYEQAAAGFKYVLSINGRDFDGYSSSKKQAKHEAAKNALTQMRPDLLAAVGMHSAQHSAWLGLPNNAEKVLLQQRADKLLKNLLAVSDDELAFGAGTGEREGDVVKPQWMAQLLELASLWLKNLPKDLTRMKRTVENIKNPLFRFFEREVNLGVNLMARIRNDLHEVMAVCRAEKKQSNETRALISYLQKGQVPLHWMEYTVPRETSLKEWFTDIAERMKQLTRVSQSTNLRAEEVWLGGVFTAEAFITATRQQVAQANTWSLEQLHLHVNLGRSNAKDVFRVTGVQLRGAKATEGNKLELSDEVSSSVDVLEMAWRKEPAEGVKVPLYLYGERKQLIASLSFQVKDATSFYQRGVALIANANL